MNKIFVVAVAGALAVAAGCGKPENAGAAKAGGSAAQSVTASSAQKTQLDLLADKNIFNIIHYDLRGRYNNCSHNNGRLGGSIGGGY